MLARYVEPRHARSIRLPHLLPAVIFIATQIVYGFAFWWYGSRDYFGTAGSWDGRFYRQIAQNGYPSAAAGDGQAIGAWAFYPLFPTVVRAVSSTAHLSIPVAAAVVNLLAGMCAIVLLSRLLERYVGARRAILATSILCAWPAAPVMQMFYTESLALLLLVVAFDRLISGRYAAALVAVAALSLTRAIAAPFAVIVAVHAWRKWGGSMPREKAVLVTTVLITASTALLWPVLAGLMSGVPTRYFDAMSAFHPDSVPATWLIWAWRNGLGAVAFLIFLLGMVSYLSLRCVPRGIPLELQLWPTVYVAYLIAASIPSFSLIRYFLFAFPAGLIVCGNRHYRSGLIVTVVACLVGMSLALSWIALTATAPAGPAP